MRTDPVASPRLRQLATEHAIDKNHDQAVSAHEIAASVTELTAKAATESRFADMARHELSTLYRFGFPHYRHYSPHFDAYGRQMYFDDYRYNRYHDHHEWSRYQHLVSQIHMHEARAAEYRAEANELQLYQGEARVPVDLMGQGFRARFRDQTPEARSALVKADVRGDNDGVLTRGEYDKYNRRPILGIFGKKRFEGHFGKAAHNAVLAALARPATDR